MSLTAKAIKATLVLDPAAVLLLAVPEGQSKITVRIAVGGRTVTADLNAKSLRRCIGAIKEAGADGVAVVLQGRLDPGDVLVEAGIVAQPKLPKPAVAA